MRRVVVTGLGAVTPIGTGVQKFWENLIAGVSGIDIIKRFDPVEIGLSVHIAGEVKDFEPERYFDKKDAQKVSDFIKFAVAASEEAIRDSGLLESKVDPYRVGVIIGTGIGGLRDIEEQQKVLMEKGPRRVSPFFIPYGISNMASGLVAIRFGFKGPNYCVVSACATGNHAIGDAMRLIQKGDIDVAIAGGCESAITPLGIAGFAVMRALSTRNDEPQKASRPFDRDRDGFVMGEGAGILVLEEYEHAKARGAKIYAELVGYGATDDAYHITAPCADGEGAYMCMKLALEDAGIRPEDVDYINAHGTSTPLNDKSETLAIKRLFGEHAYRLKISSNKSMIGHLLGAAGAVEAVATVKTIETGIIPPTINLENPDPECDLDYMPNKAIEFPVRYALSNSFGFGGTNACLIFKSLDELQQGLGYSFNNLELLIQALTHKSYAGEHGLKSYETLEFLGDSLINFFVVDILLSEFPSASEGELAMMKSYFVSEDYLHELAEELSLDMYILYGGKRKNSYVSSSLMADTFEALWAAVYLDCGRSADFVKELFSKLYKERLVSAVKNKDYKRDYKTLLQEETQKRWKERPTYRVVSVEGPHHSRVFEVECNIREFRATAKGKSKKSAQQLAAKKVLELILSSEG